MNILEAEDMVKGLPDQVLFQYAQNPPPQIPQFLAISEVQRRQDMRQRFQATQQQPQETVKDQILRGGIGATGMAPEISQAPPMAPMGAAPPGAPMQQPMTGAPMGMSMGGLTPGGIVRMQQGRTAPNLLDELRAAEQAGDTNKANQIRAQLQATGAGIPAAGAVAGQPSAYADRVSAFMGQVPGIFSQVQNMMPAGGGLSTADLERFRPTQADYLNPQAQAQREALLAELRSTGETRRAEDIAAAQRYLTEAEAPIKQAQDEARKSAIASTLMRLGAGVMAGKPEAGLAGAAESVENIMSRAREQASAERRAARTEFRQAERAATQAARGTADAAFQMQAQNITADENKQQQFVRDQNQFAQWAFGQMREAGRDARQARSDAVRLSLGLAQTIDTAIREETREAALSDRQYAQTFGTIFKEVFDDIKNGYLDAEGNEVQYTPEQAIELAGKRTRELLTTSGIAPGGSGENVVIYQGKPIRFPNKEAADTFRRSIGQ